MDGLKSSPGDSREWICPRNIPILEEPVKLCWWPYSTSLWLREQSLSPNSGQSEPGRFFLLLLPFPHYQSFLPSPLETKTKQNTKHRQVFAVWAVAPPTASEQLLNHMHSFTTLSSLAYFPFLLIIPVLLSHLSIGAMIRLTLWPLMLFASLIHLCSLSMISAIPIY